MDQYAKSFTKPSIRIGTITVLLAMLGSFFPNIYLYLAYGVWPDASHMFSAWGSIAMAFGAFYLVEPISYFPVFGPPAPTSASSPAISLRSVCPRLPPRRMFWA